MFIKVNSIQCVSNNCGVSSLLVSSSLAFGVWSLALSFCSLWSQASLLSSQPFINFFFSPQLVGGEVWWLWCVRSVGLCSVRI